MPEYDLFPELLPTSDDLTSQEVINDIFNDDWDLMRVGVVVCREQLNQELPVNGKSTKIEVAKWMANNNTREGLEIIREKARERQDE